MSTISQRLQKLRQCMRDHEVDYYFVPASDAHQNEYIPEVWQRRAWISGFTGSAGDVLVGLDSAYLWTDGRYFLQAEQELGEDYVLMKQQQGMAPIDQWLLQQEQPLRVAVDPKVLTIVQAQRLQQALVVFSGDLVIDADNWIDRVRAEPLELPKQPITLLDERYTGESVARKLQRLRDALADADVACIALNMLDQIAWLLNLRGSDIAFNPLFISYVLVNQNHATLFVAEEVINAELKEYLSEYAVQVAPYDQFADALREQEGVIQLDPNSASCWMGELCEDVVLLPSPLLHFKARKNSVEIAGMRQAHYFDALAEVRFLHWLDHSWQAGITESSAAKQLASFRQLEPTCVGMSFNTISGFADNGAIIHYAYKEESAKTIDDSNLYLVDSGGQYLSGTTDITRTVHLGTPTAQQKFHYTLVLKGHLALARAVFPQGTSGQHLDALARQFLWAEGLDYGHGTGHGVGCHLCVHEGPIAVRRSGGSALLEPGMIISNEPGFYLPGEYGIRIENLLLITESAHAHDHGKFYQFEDLVLVPYARKLIDVAMLTSAERQQVNCYHERIYQSLSDALTEEPRQWLAQACAEI